MNKTFTKIAAVALAVALLAGGAFAVGATVVGRALATGSLAPLVRSVAASAGNAGENLLPQRVAAALPGATTAQTTTEEGILVASVAPDSPAARAGIVRGDIILKVNDQDVSALDQLSRALQNLKDGDRLSLTVRHGDEQKRLTVTIATNNGSPYLGISTCGMCLQARRTVSNPPGAVIVSVQTDSAAARAGLQPGDRIISVDGQAVDAQSSLSDLIGAHKAGDSVTLEVAGVQDTPSRTLMVTLGDNPNKAGAGFLGVRTVAAPAFNMQPGEGVLPFDGNPPGGMPFFHGTTPYTPTVGIVVRSVATDSPASTADLKVGDVIDTVDGQQVSDLAGLRSVLANHKPGDTIALSVTRSGETAQTTLQVTLGENPNQAGQAYLGVSVSNGLRRFRVPNNNNNNGNNGMPSFPFGLPFNPAPRSTPAVPPGSM